MLSAVFLREGFTFKRHAALRSALHERLIQTGRIDQAWGSTFDRLAELRSKSVYGALFDLDMPTARAVVDAARLLRDIAMANHDRVVEHVNLELRPRGQVELVANRFWDDDPPRTIDGSFHARTVFLLPSPVNNEATW
jgi:hypothetical protein